MTHYLVALACLLLGYLVGRGTHQRKLDRALKAYIRDDRPYLRRRP